MADKLSWVDLRRALSERAGESQKTAGLFLAAFNAQIIEALKQDKQVKINGLGTFRLQGVAPRRSVNVTTGEEMIIEGYNKVVFSPEVGVREMIEKMDVEARGERLEANGERVEANGEVGEANEGIDPLKRLSEQAEEIVGILGELESLDTPVDTPMDDSVEPKEPEVPEQPEEPKEPEQPEEPEEPKEPVVVPPVEPIEPVQPIEPIIVEPIKPIETMETDKPVEPAEQVRPAKKKSHFWRNTLICLILLLALALVGYFFFRPQLQAGVAWVTNLLQPQPEEPVEVVEPEVVDTIAVDEPTPVEEEGLVPLDPNGEVTDELIFAEFEAISEDTELPTMVAEQPYKDLITTEQMHEASRLTWMAKRYYGDKAFWPYLYDANRDHITNPSKIEVGTPIRVPRLTAEQMDLSIESSRLNLERLREEAEAACRK